MSEVPHLLEKDPRPIIEPQFKDERTIHQRMVAILAELPEIGKGQWNAEQKFAFRGYDDVMNHLKPLLAKHGVFVVPNVVGRKVAHRETKRGSTMYEVNLHVEFSFYGAGGDCVTASGWGEGTDMGDKATNKAMTGAFKYVLFQVFAIATGEIPDSDAAGAEETTRGGAQKPAGGQRASQRPFDPSRDLIPGAISVRSAEDADHLRRAQRDLAPDENWTAIENEVVQHVFSKGLDDLTRAETGQFWVRLANAVAKSYEGGEFPPPSRDQIQQAYAMAFDGIFPALESLDTPFENAKPVGDEAVPRTEEA